MPGGAMASMMARSFGGKSQQVRRKGGSIDAQVAAGTAAAVTEYFLEKMTSVGKFQTKYFGSGTVDDILDGVVAAVEDLGSTRSGKAWLNHLATGSFSFLTEGVEEGLSGILDVCDEKTNTTVRANTEFYVARQRERSTCLVCVVWKGFRPQPSSRNDLRNVGDQRLYCFC